MGEVKGTKSKHMDSQWYKYPEDTSNGSILEHSTYNLCKKGLKPLRFCFLKEGRAHLVCTVSSQEKVLENESSYDGQRQAVGSSGQLNASSAEAKIL